MTMLHLPSAHGIDVDTIRTQYSFWHRYWMLLVNLVGAFDAMTVEMQYRDRNRESWVLEQD
jgi:hypothetical protein